MVTDAAYYTTIIEELATALEALDTSGYQWQPSDGWTHTTRWGPSDTSQHLETWIDLGAITQSRQTYWVHAAELHVSLRYAPDDDSVSQGRIHAAMRAALDLLATWSSTSGVRSSPTGATISGTDREGWVVGMISFDLLFPAQ